MTSTTRYQKAGQSATLADITTGSAIMAEGTSNSDGSLTAMLVTIQLPHLGGKVTAINGSSYTVSGRGGSTYTITATPSTTYSTPAAATGTTAAAAAITTGSYIEAEGTLSTDGKTLTALHIVILPAGGRFGGPGSGGFGGPGDADGHVGGQGGNLGSPGSTLGSAGSVPAV